MTEIWLNHEELLGLAKGLRGWSERNLRTLVNKRELKTRITRTRSRNGRRMREYLLESLPYEIRAKLAERAATAAVRLVTPVLASHADLVPLRARASVLNAPRIVLSDPKDQEQAAYRLSVITPLLEFRALIKSDRAIWLRDRGLPVMNVEAFAEHLALDQQKLGKRCSRPTLFDWMDRFKREGFPGLADRVRADKGQSRWFKQHPQAAILAAYLHLNERQSVTFVHEQLHLNAGQLGLQTDELPSHETVRIFLAQQISPAMKALAREGQREYRERMAPYLRRMYTDIFANQVWVGDTAILDIECQNDVFSEIADFAPLRLRVTAFEDFRSRKFIAATFSVEGSSISISAALLRGILRFGLPEMIYVDNGKDYKKVAKGAASGFELVSDSDIQPLVDKGLLARLGIGVTHCIPRHPQSKHVERMFRTMHMRFDAVHSTYTGGSPATRPESTELAMMHHRRLLKKGRADLSRHPYASHIVAGCLSWIEEYNSRPHQGEGMEGMSPNEVFAACLNPKQRPTPEQQQLAMLMAEYKECTVDSCAVRLNRRRYMPRNEDRAAWGAMHEQNERRVLVAYNPTDPEFAVALDLDGHYLAWLVMEQLVRFAPNDAAVQRQIGESMEIRRGLERVTKQTLQTIEIAARANGAKSAEEMLYDRLQLPAAAGEAITHLTPRLAPAKRAEAPMTPAQVARELSGKASNE
jgi:putative transposase